MKIGILNKIINPDIEKKAVNFNDEIVFECLNASCEQELFFRDMSAYDAVIISYKFRVSKELIDLLINCKSIVCACVGFDNVDYKYAAFKGIKVFNVPDYGTNDVADHTLALFLSYARRIITYNFNVKSDPRKKWNPKLVRTYHRLAGMNFGIIGLGRIGTAVAFRARALGMNVLFYDPYIPSGYDKTYQFKRCNDLYELIEQSNVISIHAPLTDETFHMIDYKCLENARHQPIIINTARGKIIDSSSICFALKNNIIDAFLCDVLELEPPSQYDELIALANTPDYFDRIVITPHAASYAEESQYDMRYKAAERAMKSLFDTGYITDCVNYTGEITWRQ
jgi:D-isomer specific 2-hydroxyacid dehydrogenase family protein